MTTYARARSDESRHRRHLGRTCSGPALDSKPLRLPPRRAVLHRGRPSPRMGLRRPATAHASARTTVPSDVRVVGSRVASAVRARRDDRGPGDRVAREAPRWHAEGTHPRRGVHGRRCSRPRGDPHLEHHHVRPARMGARALVGHSDPPGRRPAPLDRRRRRRRHRAAQQAPRPVPRDLPRDRDRPRTPRRRAPVVVARCGCRARPASSGVRTSSGKRRTAGRSSTWPGRIADSDGAENRATLVPLQLLLLGPLLLPIWGSGLWWLARSREAQTPAPARVDLPGLARRRVRRRGQELLRGAGAPRVPRRGMRRRRPMDEDVGTRWWPSAYSWR